MSSFPMEEFLKASDAINCNHPLVWLCASRLAAGSSGSVEKARTIFEFVRDEVLFTPAMPYPASAVLERREGICVCKALLFTALCRSVGIPTGLVFQGFRGAQTADSYRLHGLAAAYLAGQWVRLDPRGGTVTQVEFDPVRGSLLPPSDFSLVHYPGIYADLPDEFVDALQRESWEIAWPDALMTPPTTFVEW